MTDLEFAEEFARRAHRGQVDKSGVDYILHPLTVASLVETDEEKTVALLHDVLEDTPVTESTLRRLFGDRITEAVLALTKREGEAYFDFVRRAKADPLSRAVKIADITHNSDLTRLDQITQRDLDRVEKYRAALKILQE